MTVPEVPGWVLALFGVWIVAVSGGLIDLRVVVGRVLQRLDTAGIGVPPSTRARNGRRRA